MSAYTINAFEFCRLAESATGTTPVAELPRLCADVHDHKGELTWSFQGGRHSEGLAQLSLADVGVTDADRRVKYSGFKLPPEKPAGKKFDATDAAKQKDVVAQVVGLLRTEAKVL